MFTFFDTETSDRWDFKAPWNAEHQPHLVQLGYEIYDRNRSLVKTVDVVVDSRQLTGWNGIEPGASAVHGITEERMATEGVHPEFVAKQLVDDFSSCGITIAHNNEFDMKILQCFLYRCGYTPDVLFQGKHNLCTMKPLTNILKIANKNGRAGYKWPTLTEAYMSLVDSKGFEGAHDALTDVRACRDIFWAVWDQRIVPQYKEAWELANVHRS
jgi:DNA polymerase-3 subunit epsilon